MADRPGEVRPHKEKHPCQEIHLTQHPTPPSQPHPPPSWPGGRSTPRSRRFCATEARFSFYVGGVGAGKTTAGALRALTRALDHPGSLGLIGAPTYPMLRDATQRTFFSLLPEEMKYTFHKVEGHLTLDNGSEILFRSLDAPDRLRGLNLAWFWLDEAPLCGYYAWQILKARLRQRGYATAGWATGTPKGRDGFARDFELTPRPAHALYRAATSANAANLPPDYIEDIGLSGALYDQEVLGLFTAFEGLVYAFAADLTDGHLHEPAPDQRFARIIGGVDWGYTNPTAAVCLRPGWRRPRLATGRVLPAARPARCRRRARVGRSDASATASRRGTVAPTSRSISPRCRRRCSRRVSRAARCPPRTRCAPASRPSRACWAAGETAPVASTVAPRCVHTIAEYGMYQYPPDPLAGTSGSPLLVGEGPGVRSGARSPSCP